MKNISITSSIVTNFEYNLRCVPTPPQLQSHSLLWLGPQPLTTSPFPLNHIPIQLGIQPIPSVWPAAPHSLSPASHSSPYPHHRIEYPCPGLACSHTLPPSFYTFIHSYKINKISIAKGCRGVP